MAIFDIHRDFEKYGDSAAQHKSTVVPVIFYQIIGIPILFPNLDLRDTVYQLS